MFKAVGRDHRRRDDDLPQVRLPPRRATRRPRSPGSTWPPARSARACRSRSASRWPARTWTSCPYHVWIALRRLRARRGLDLGGPRQGRPTTSCPTSPPSSTSTGSASAARPSSAGTSTSTAAASRRSAASPIVIDGHDVTAIDRAFGTALSNDRQADRDHRQDHQGQGLLGDREQGRLARQGAAAGHGRAGDQGARRHPQPQGQDRASPRPSPRARRSAPDGGRRPAHLQEGRQGRHPQGVRRRAARARRDPRGRGDGRRGLELDPRRRVREGLSRTASSRSTSPSSSWSRRRWA